MYKIKTENCKNLWVSTKCLTIELYLQISRNEKYFSRPLKLKKLLHENEGPLTLDKKVISFKKKRTLWLTKVFYTIKRDVLCFKAPWNLFEHAQEGNQKSEKELLA